MGGQPLSVDLQHRQVGRPVASHDGSGVAAAVGQGHRYLIRRLDGADSDDVVVGDDVPLLIDYEARAYPYLGLWTCTTEGRRCSTRSAVEEMTEMVGDGEGPGVAVVPVGLGVTVVVDEVPPPQAVATIVRADRARARIRTASRRNGPTSFGCAYPLTKV